VTDLQAGFAVADVGLTRDQCDHLASSLPIIGAGRGGMRGLVAHPTVLQLIRHQQFAQCLWSVVGRELVAIKATLFDKMSESDWRVQWHQDRLIAVRERLNVAGYGPWSTKVGVVYVEPPTSVLQQMLTAWIPLDDGGPEDGPLRVLPGSHEWGKLTEQDLQQRVATEAPVHPRLPKGALLFTRPLLVHSSRPSGATGHRRMLHIELAPAEAISPLHWQTAIHLRRAA
jgi:ectoine hydroxylase-related dioxygenase (phytanoyl-CoA dioxygenase family)